MDKITAEQALNWIVDHAGQIPERGFTGGWISFPNREMEWWEEAFWGSTPLKVIRKLMRDEIERSALKENNQ